MLKIFLEGCGAQVVACDSGGEALQEFSQSIPDVMVCDIGLSDMSGHDLMQQIRSLSVLEGGQMPAIALSGFARKQDQDRSLASGFQLHLNKPIDPDQLIEEIHKLIHQGATS